MLLPLFQQQGQWHLLYIRRAVNARDRHSGEVAFPGGRIEADDPHATAAALREAEEEIGLPQAAVAILGRLPRFHTASHYVVTPVLGLIAWPQPLRPDPREVARVFSLPLSWLADPRNHEERPWHPQGQPRPRSVIFYQERDGERLWGITARITLSLVQALGDPA